MAQLGYQLGEGGIIAHVKGIVGKVLAGKSDGVLIEIDSAIDVIGKMFLDEAKNIGSAAAELEQEDRTRRREARSPARSTSVANTPDPCCASRSFNRGA